MNKTNKKLKLELENCIIDHRAGVAVYATIILKDKNSRKLFSFTASKFEFDLEEQNNYKDVKNE